MLGRVIEKAEDSTASQLQAGKEQADAMTALMNGLMRKLQESSSASSRAYLRSLPPFDDLSRRVETLSQDM